MPASMEQMMDYEHFFLIHFAINTFHTETFVYQWEYSIQSELLHQYAHFLSSLCWAGGHRAGMLTSIALITTTIHGVLFQVK